VVRTGLAKDHVGQSNDQFGMAGDFRAELTAVDAVRQLSLGGDERPQRRRVAAVQDARVAPETKGADFG